MKDMNLHELLRLLNNHERALELMEEMGADEVFDGLWDAAVPGFEAIAAFNPYTDEIEYYLFSSSTRLHPDSELIILSRLPLGDSVSSGVEEDMFSRDEWDEIGDEPYEGDAGLWLEDYLKKNPGAYTWEERAEEVFRFYYVEKGGYWDDVEALRSEIRSLRIELEEFRAADTEEALQEIEDLENEIEALQEGIENLREEMI